jgi:hypothetical protein
MGVRDRDREKISERGVKISKVGLQREGKVARERDR